MFENALAMEYGRPNRAWTTMAGFAGQALLIAGAVLAPLVGPQGLPRPQSLVTLFYPSAPAAPPPRAEAAPAAPHITRAPMQLRDGALTAPVRMPEKAAILTEPPLTPAELGGGTGGVRGGVEGGIPNGILHGLPAAVAAQTPPPAPVRPAAQAAPEKPAPDPVRIRQGGQVQHARLVRQVVPEYPALARQARIWGSVELLGVIGTDGSIRQLQVVSGHPLLVNAALEAVRQWVYRPTYLNGDAVEVVAPITVSFVMR